jgi:hypothetical protein
VRWRPGEADVSACERRHLPLWIWEELWEIELDGAIVRRGHKLRAPRGRLGRRIEAWSPSAAKGFAHACARGAASLAAAPLREAAFADAAGVFNDADDLKAVRALTRSLWDELPNEARRPVGMASDAADCARTAARTDDAYVAAQKSAEVAYIAAMVALHVAGRAGHDAERARQADWLSAELGLIAD